MEGMWFIVGAEDEDGHGLKLGIGLGWNGDGRLWLLYQNTLFRGKEENKFCGFGGLKTLVVDASGVFFNHMGPNFLYTNNF